MRYWIWLLCIPAFFIGLTVPAEARKARETKQIEKMDTDNDEKVSLDEWTAYSTQRFKEKDTDQDGYLTADEMKPPHGRRWEKRGEGREDAPPEDE